MNFLPPSLGLVAIALAAATLLQTGSGDPTKPPAKSPEKSTAKPVRAEMLDQLYGVWKLTELDTPVLKAERREETGYLLIAEHFLSLECHIGWMGDSGMREASTFFTGTHEYQLGDDGLLVLRSLIGSTIDPNGKLPVFEPIGRRREYKLEVDGPKLVMRRQVDQQTLVFERVTARLGGLDFYGRKKPAEPIETPPVPPKKDKDG